MMVDALYWHIVFGLDNAWGNTHLYHGVTSFDIGQWVYIIDPPTPWWHWWAQPGFWAGLLTGVFLEHLRGKFR